MISPNKYKLITKGICSHCNADTLKSIPQQGYKCPVCGYVYLIDKRRQYVLEPDCQKY